jgi:hypothetical protein
MISGMTLSQRLRAAGVGRGYTGRRKPQMLVIGDYRPDLPDYLGNVSIKNCIPVGKRAYEQQRALGIINSSSALTARCQGAVGVIDQTNLHSSSFSADASKLYELIGATQTDRSKSGGYNCASDEWWTAVRFGTKLLMGNIADAVQSKTIGSTDLFADHFTSTLKPKTRNLAVAKQFLFTANNEEDGTRFPNRIRWGAVGNSLDQDSSASNQSDAQDLEGVGGPIQALVGRNYITVFQEHAIQRGTYVGDPVVWRFDEVELNRGLFAPKATVSYGFWDFYLAEDGFHIFNGAKSIPIGEGKVNRFFLSDLLESAKHRVTMAIRPEKSLLYVAYPNSSATSENPNRMLVLHWPTGRWTICEITCEMIFSDFSRGYTIDELDAAFGTSIDDTTVFLHSFDSRVYSGGKAQLAAFDTAHKYNDFSGSALTAAIDTIEKELGRGRRFRPTKARPIVDGGTTTVAVGHRRRLADSNAFGSAVSAGSNGDHDLTAQKLEDRYHRFRLSISGGFNDASGIEIEGHQTGWSE